MRDTTTNENIKLMERLRASQFEYLTKKYGEEKAKELMEAQDKYNNDKYFKKKIDVRLFLNGEFGKFYLNEIITLKEHKLYLSLIMVAGCFSESLAWDISDSLSKKDLLLDESEDSDAKMYYLLKKMLNKDKITKTQYDLFEQIRKIRNRYVHPKLGKIFEKEGIATKFYKGYSLHAPSFFVGEDVEKVAVVEYKKIVEKDALKILNLFNNLIRSLAIK